MAAHYWAAITIAVMTSGCISNPARGTTATGDPLRVAILSGTGTRVVQQEAGSSVTTHSDGSETSTTHYRNVAQKFKWKTWRFYQGGNEIDEQDWFALTDPRASAEIASARARAYRAQQIGLPMAVVGIGAMLYAQYGVDRASNTSLSTVAYIGGALLASAGSTLYTLGVRKMRDRTILPLSRGFDAAEEVDHCKSGRCRPVKWQRRRLGMRRQ